MIEVNKEINIQGNPRFIARVNWPSSNLRLYVHEGGLEHYYGQTQEKKIDQAIAYGRVCFERRDIRKVIGFNPQQGDFLIAAVWNNQRAPTVDFFKFWDYTGWPGNPEVKPFVFKDGIYQRDAAGCEDGVIVLSAEAQYRRRTPSLQFFLDNPPQIQGISLEKDITGIPIELKWQKHEE